MIADAFAAVGAEVAGPDAIGDVGGTGIEICFAARSGIGVVSRLAGVDVEVAGALVELAAAVVEMHPLAGSMGRMAMPMTIPNLTMGAPSGMAARATLWPSSMFSRAARLELGAGPTIWSGAPAAASPSNVATLSEACT